MFANMFPNNMRVLSSLAVGLKLAELTIQAIANSIKLDSESLIQHDQLTDKATWPYPER